MPRSTGIAARAATSGFVVALVAAAALVGPAPAAAQGLTPVIRHIAPVDSTAWIHDSTGNDDEVALPPASDHLRSEADSLDWIRARARADFSTGFRVVVSIQDRHLWVIDGRDTVLSALVAVAKGTTLEFGGREWTFRTPRGVRTVLDKEADPVWQPPDWLYAETAKQYGFALKRMPVTGTVPLDDGRALAIHDHVVGVIDHDGEFTALPTAEHIVFDSTLFIPPFGTANRRIAGALGRYRLDLGDGYLLHGTPDKGSIGSAATHGCIRLQDDDIEWLFVHVPVGTRVYIY